MKKLFLAFSLFGLLGCAEEKVTKPAGLLPDSKLISLLADIHIAESRLEAMRLSPDTGGVVFKQLQSEIFKNQKVSEAQFNKTYNYYLQNVAKLDKIYEGLVDTLAVREIKAAAPVTSTTDPDSAALMVKDRKQQIIENIRKRRQKDSLL